MKDWLLIYPNLGLGDAIIVNPIIRHYAREHELVCVPVKYGNVVSVQYMLRDLPNVVIRPVEDDEDARYFSDEVWKKGFKLNLGHHNQPFNGRAFDQEFYRQAGLDFDLRWSGWKCDRDTAAEEATFQRMGKGVMNGGHILFHCDERFPMLQGKVKPTTNAAQRFVENFNTPLMTWRKSIETATELHCINSSVALFIDSIDLPNNPPLFLHAYARKGEMPTFKKDWKILE